jgi:hypothetical protein
LQTHTEIDFITHCHVVILLNKHYHHIGVTNNHDFLNLTGGAEFQFTWTQNRTYSQFASLYTDVQLEYSTEYIQITKNNRTYIDPFIFDLKNAISLIEEYGMRLESLIYLESGFDTNSVFQPNNKPGRSDMCECANTNRYIYINAHIYVHILMIIFICSYSH